MKRMKIFKSMIGIRLLALICSGCCSEGINSDVIIIPQEEWVNMLNSTFEGVDLRINNFTPNAHEFREADEFAHYKPNDSFFRIDRLGLSFNFDVPVQRNDPYSSYVNDINSRSFVAGTRSRKALISIQMEDSGTEILGYCINNFFCFCGNPRFDLTGTSIDILLTLGDNGTDLIIEDIEASLNSSFTESGPCVKNVCAFLCDILAPERESLIRSSIEQQVELFISDNRAILEGLFNSYLDSQGITGRITNVLIGVDGELIITEETDVESCPM